MADKNQRTAHTLTQANRRFPRKNTEEGLTLVVVLGVGIALWTFALWGPLPAFVITALWYEMAYLTWRGNHRHRKRESRRAQQTHIAQLEAELGLPVLMAGECWNCR